jgi:hypothetical protein
MDSGLLASGERVLTGDRVFHLSALGEALPGCTRAAPAG